MGAASVKAFEDQTGVSAEELQASSIAKIDPITSQVSFLPTRVHGPNYSKIIHKLGQLPYLPQSAVKEAVLAYTNHETGFCTKLNWLLAADTQKLSQQAESIRRLDYAISSLSSVYPAGSKEVYRGLWINETEFNAYPLGEFIYIPSFMSTSRNPGKFYKNPKVNCLIVIRMGCRPKRAFEVGREFSIYYETEEETLFSCYNRFKVENKARGKEFNGQIFEYKIVLAVVNEDYSSKDQKVLSFLTLL